MAQGQNQTYATMVGGKLSHQWLIPAPPRLTSDPPHTLGAMGWPFKWEKIVVKKVF